MSWEPVTQHWPVGPPGARMLTFCRVCNPEHDTVGGDLRPCNKFWISGKQRYDDGPVKKFGKRSKPQEERTEEHDNDVKKQKKYRSWKRASTVLVECVNSCLPSNPLWYFKLASGLESEEVSRVGGVSERRASSVRGSVSLPKDHRRVSLSGRRVRSCDSPQVLDLLVFCLGTSVMIQS